MYDKFNLPVTYETAPQAIKEIIDRHEDNRDYLQTMTCVPFSYEEPWMNNRRFIMLFKVRNGGFIISEVWMRANDTVCSDGEVYISPDEVSVFVDFFLAKGAE